MWDLEAENPHGEGVGLIGLANSAAGMGTTFPHEEHLKKRSQTMLFGHVDRQVDHQRAGFLEIRPHVDGRDTPLYLRRCTTVDLGGWARPS